MAYERQTWKSGDVVTSEKLNHMEGGIEAGGLPIVPTTSTNPESFTCTKTFGEIKAMVDAGTPPLIKMAYDSGTGVALVYYFPVIGYMLTEGQYALVVRTMEMIQVAIPSVDSYPVIMPSGGGGGQS